jgi:hypothetical protein
MTHSSNMLTLCLLSCLVTTSLPAKEFHALLITLFFIDFIDHVLIKSYDINASMTHILMTMSQSHFTRHTNIIHTVLTVHHHITSLMWSSTGQCTTIPASKITALVGAGSLSLKSLSHACLSQMEVVGWSSCIRFDMVWLPFDIYCSEFVFVLSCESFIIVCSMWNVFTISFLKKSKWLAFLASSITK